jgi:hypothetical protein
VVLARGRTNERERERERERQSERERERERERVCWSGGEEARYMQCGSSSGLVVGESSAVEAFDKCLARWMLRKTLVSSYPTTTTGLVVTGDGLLWPMGG